MTVVFGAARSVYRRTEKKIGLRADFF